MNGSSRRTTPTSSNSRELITQPPMSRMPSRRSWPKGHGHGTQTLSTANQARHHRERKAAGAATGVCWKAVEPTVLALRYHALAGGLVLERVVQTLMMSFTWWVKRDVADELRQRLIGTFLQTERAGAPCSRHQLDRDDPHRRGQAAALHLLPWQRNLRPQGPPPDGMDRVVVRVIQHFAKDP